MVPPDDPEHECGWQGYAKSLEKRLAEVEKQLEQLARHKSEKLPPLERERRRSRDSDERLAEAKRKREERALAKSKLVTETIDIKVPEAERRCPHCSNAELRSVGDGKPSTVFEYIPGYFRRRIFRRETLSCRCGQYIVNAPAPERTTDKTQYGPSFIAHLIVSKCGDSIPLYRLEKQYRRLGIPISRSTMTDLFHRHAELLAPLPARLLERVRQSELVFGDETSIKMLGSTKRAYVGPSSPTSSLPIASALTAAAKRRSRYSAARKARSSSMATRATTRLRRLTVAVALAVSRTPGASYSPQWKASPKRSKHSI